MSDHARLAPSASHRWLNCTASVEASQRYHDPQGEEAAEGTAAHWVLEQCLTGGYQPRDFLGRTIVVRENHVERRFVVDGDMAHDVDVGVDYIRSVAQQPGWSGVEQRVDLSCFEHGLFGTTDLWHVARDASLLTLADFKYGHGDVSPVENPQLLLYLCGVLDMLRRGVLAGNMPERCRVVIIQPRSVVPGPRVKEWDVPAGYLDGIDENIRAITGIAIAKGGFVARVQDAITGVNRFAEFKMGQWCRHCPALGECPLTVAEAQGLAPSLLAADLTVMDAERILARRDLLERVVEKAEGVMLKALIAGHRGSRFPLVVGTKHRVWRDENLARQRLEEAVGPGCLRPPTPAQAEKLGRDAKQIVAELSVTPAGEPKVGKVGDTRPPYVARSTEQMFGKPS
jgi:hypothetical protein